MKTFLITTVVFFSFLSQALAQAPIPCWPWTDGPTDHTYTYVDSTGTAVIYDYKIYTPPGYNCGGVASPMVAMFHGGGQPMVDFVTSDFGLEFIAQADIYNAILVAMESGPDLQWNHEVGSFAPTHEHVGATSGLLKLLAGPAAGPGGIMNVDRDQLHGLGFSNGGIFLQYLSIQKPNMFGAIAVIASVSSAYESPAPSCVPFTAGCISTFDNVWGQSSPITTPTAVDVMLIRGKLDFTFLELGGWFANDILTTVYTLASKDTVNPSEYELWKASVGCTVETTFVTADVTRERCNGATDLRLDIVDAMWHKMPVLADTGYDGPSRVATFLFNHPK